MAVKDDLAVIVGAAGHQCSHIIPRLYTKIALRLVVNSDKSAKTLAQKYPDAEVIAADLALPTDCDRVLRGASTVYHLGPTLHPNEKEMGLNMVAAAVAESEAPGSRFKHFVFSSVLNTQLRKMHNHDDKRYIEEALILSGLNYTVLQPGDFLEVGIPVKAWLNEEKPVCHSFIAQETRSSFVALKDLGEVAAKVILERERHFQALYPLVSVGPITYGDATSYVAKVIGKEISIERYSVEEGAKWILDSLFGDHEKAGPVRRDKMESLTLFYSRRGIQGNSNVLEWLLERKPTSLSSYVGYEREALASAANDK